MSQGKLKVIKDFEKLDASLQKLIKDAYPAGFADELITITNKDGALIRALPFETDEKYYLVKMPVNDSKLVEDDEFDEEVIVKESKKPDLGEDFDDGFDSGEEEEADDYDDDVADDEYDEDEADDED